MMNAAPRNLPVFSKYAHEQAESPLPETPAVIASFNAVDCATDCPEPCEGLGYEGGDAIIPVGETLTFEFASRTPAATIAVRMVPTHPVSSPQLRFTISVDGRDPVEFAYETYDRSEEWKENVLNNQAVRDVHLDLPAGKHTISFTVLDEGEVLDRIIVL